MPTTKSTWSSTVRSKRSAFYVASTSTTVNASLVSTGQKCNKKLRINNYYETKCRGICRRYALLPFIFALWRLQKSRAFWLRCLRSFVCHSLTHRIHVVTVKRHVDKLSIFHSFASLFFSCRLCAANVHSTKRQQQPQNITTDSPFHRRICPVVNAVARYFLKVIESQLPFVVITSIFYRSFFLIRKKMGPLTMTILENKNQLKIKSE